MATVGAVVDPDNAEQVIVTFALLPLRFIRRRGDSGIDGIANGNETSPATVETTDSDDVVIDLRSRNRDRLVAAEQVETGGSSSTADRTDQSGP